MNRAKRVGVDIDCVEIPVVISVVKIWSIGGLEKFAKHLTNITRFLRTSIVILEVIWICIGLSF